MEFISLLEPAPPSTRRLTRAEALVLSFALHLIAILLYLYLPEVLPASLVAFFSARPRPPELSAAAQSPPPVPLFARPQPKPNIPLEFAYVKVPNDVPASRNPKATLLSDKDRLARQEVPTPPDVRKFSRDPHSEGQAIERVRPDPSRPEGRESPETPEPSPARHSGGDGGTEMAHAEAGDRGEGKGSATPAEEGTIVSKASPGGPGDSTEPPAQRAGTGPGTGGESTDDLKHAPLDLQPPEYKFTFRNPSFLNGAANGTLSFDTKDFPWGDYGRRLYLTIRNNWIDRLPLAYREGIRGYACVRFIIEKNGVISRILTLRPSAVPPFDKAASDAIRASGPLPPLPEGFPKDREGVTGCFYYNMYPGEAEQGGN